MQPEPQGREEKASSAVTLSDMEIFVFPELLYSLVLANIMSPALWRWREDPWFSGLDRMTPYRRILRLKQFIIDHYEFNLDLDTWGLTTKERELRRFAPWMDRETLTKSNALFGYEGDRYYFSIDIRRHFGLDKYEGDIIPYWKTETLEAMDAFRFREGYRTGAGECVSLSTLYAAALFVVCGIPLDDIFLMATPLHSQNFVLVNDGVLTNNRRIVTKNMWFNGTELSEKAQRALRNEQVTVVAHHTGWIHSVYPETSIDPDAYARFASALRAFLRTEITMEVLVNFLRQASDAQACFQLKTDRHGGPHYLPIEVAFRYEHSSNYRVSDRTRAKLLDEIDDDEFFVEPIPDRLVLDDLDERFRSQRFDLAKPKDMDRLMEALDCRCLRKRAALEKLVAFAALEPRLPDPAEGRRPVAPHPLGLEPDMSREEIVAHLAELRGVHPMAELAFHAFRDLSRVDWGPFLKAALERNPVCVAGAEGRSDAEVEALLEELPNTSIYEGPRAAQPDEVWNYQRGDGFERAVCLAAVLRARHPEQPMRLEATPDAARLHVNGRVVAWPSAKGLSGTADLPPAAPG